MENEKITIKVDAIEILRGKFSNSISKINSALGEAKGDMLRTTGRNWTPEAVAQRFEWIKAAFENDLQKLSKDIAV